MRTIKISDSKNGYLLFDLRDILSLIENGSEFKWQMKKMDFNVLEPSSKYKNMDDADFAFIELIMNTHDYSVRWDELKTISKYNIQVLNGEVIGQKNDKLITLEIFDGSYWTIKTNVDALFEKIKEKFSDIIVV